LSLTRYRCRVIGGESANPRSGGPVVDGGLRVTFPSNWACSLRLSPLPPVIGDQPNARQKIEDENTSRDVQRDCSWVGFETGLPSPNDPRPTASAIRGVTDVCTFHSHLPRFHTHARKSHTPRFPGRHRPIQRLDHKVRGAIGPRITPHFCVPMDVWEVWELRFGGFG
jgi:hypothetical protein